MAKLWHKVVVNGFARYRASASRAYVSYDVAKDSWSSKMLPGNMPVEQLAKAPKSIKVKGSAWGSEVVRSYLEGEMPVTHLFAHKGKSKQFSWDKAKALGLDWGKGQDDDRCFEPAQPDYVYFDNYSRTESSRADSVKTLAYYQDRIAKGESSGENDVCIVELR